MKKGRELSIYEQIENNKSWDYTFWGIAITIFMLGIAFFVSRDYSLGKPTLAVSLAGMAIVLITKFIEGRVDRK